METRLFWIGIAMAAFAWLSKRWKESGAIDTALKSGLWHGLFLGMAGFSVVLVLAMSMEGRGRFISVAAHSFSSAELYPSILAGLLCGLFGFWRARKAGKQAKKREYYLSEDLEWSETVFSAVLLAAVLMYFVVQAFKIPSGSMRNTFLEGDHLFVNKFVYGMRIPFTGKRVLALRKVQRGDIVVFRFPSENSKKLHCGSIQYGKDFIKRVVGLPGDTVEVIGGMLKVNGQLLKEPYVSAGNRDLFRQGESPRGRAMADERYQDLWEDRKLDKTLEGMMRDYFGPVTVPEDSYMAMGDNRDHSCDSRYWGPVDMKNLKGRAWLIYWPPSRMGVVQ